MMNKQLLRAGIIGLGVGRQHALALAAHPLCEVSTLCDLDEQRLAQIGKEFPQAKRTRHWSDIVNDQTIDLVCIASYDDAHCEQAVSALSMGKHVFIEKPMCLHPEEARAIKAALDSNSDAQLSSNLPLRTCPRFQELRKTVRSGKMGTVYHLEGHYLWGRPEKLTLGWRANMDFYSIIHGGAVHMIDTILWITGKRPVSVHALGSNFSSKGTALRYNDFATMTLRFADASSATVSVHGGCVHPHHHRLAAYGTHKTFFQDSTTAVWIESNDPNLPPSKDTFSYPAKAARGGVLSSFADSILGKADQPMVTSQDAFDTMAACLAAEQSVATGKELTIDYNSFKATQ